MTAKKINICPICRKRVERPNAKFCSPDCKLKAEKVRKNGKKKRIICPICKKTVKRTNSKFCSEKCKDIYNKRKRDNDLKYLWLYVSNDGLELPIYIEDTARELAEKKGVSENTVRSSVWRYEHKGIGFYRKVERF